MSKLSDVIAEIGAPTPYKKRDAFIGSAALCALLLDAMGPLVGYPSVAGWLYAATRAVTPHPVIWQLVLLLGPQIVAGALGARAISRSAWGRWFSIRVKGRETLPLPEVHLRETALGVVTGAVVWLLIVLQTGQLPDPRRSLVVAEAFLLGTGAVVVVVALAFWPKRQYHVTEAEDRILWVIPQATSPIEILLDPTAFLKSLLLRVVPAGYAIWDAKAPIRLDAGEFLLLNLGALESAIRAPLQVKSANVLQSAAQLFVSVAPVSARTVLHKQGVSYLVNNLYTKPDLVDFLKSQLSLAMDEYAGEFDATVKSMRETFRLWSLRTDTTVAADRLKLRGTSPFHGPDTSMEDVEVMRERIEKRLGELERFRLSWAGARRLQEGGKRDLPPVFDARVKAHFRREMSMYSERAWESAALLLNIARIGVFVSEVDFTEKAIETEQMLTAVIDTTTDELKAVESRFSDEWRKRRDEIRLLLDEKIKSIDARLLLTPRGKRLFEQLMTLRMLEWDTAIASAMPEMRAEVEGVPTRPADKSPAGLKPVLGGTLVLGGVVSPSGPSPAMATPATRRADMTPAAAPTEVPEPPAPSSGLRFGPTSRDTSSRSHSSPSPIPSRARDDAEEPM